MKFNSLTAVFAATLVVFSCNKATNTPNILPGDNQEQEQEQGENEDETGGGSLTKYVEDFAGYTNGIKSAYSAEEFFTSNTTGVRWDLLFGCIDQTEDQAEFNGGHCFTLGGKAGKDDDGQSVLTTSILTGGITKLEFDYVANKDKKLEVQALVDGKTVWTSGALQLTNNGQSDPKVLEHLSFDIKGAGKDAVLKFINISSARRISIGNIQWYDAVGGTGKASDGEAGDTGDDSGNEDEGGDDSGDEDDTTLTGDVTVTGISSAAIYTYGDCFESGTNDCLIDLCNDKGEGVMVEFFTSLSAQNFNGTYTLDQEFTCAVNTALPGYTDEEGYMWGSWYYVLDEEGYCTEYACGISGTLTITSTGASITLYDSKSHKIICNYTGKMEVYDDTSAEAAGVKSSLTKARRPAHKPLASGKILHRARTK